MTKRELLEQLEEIETNLNNYNLSVSDGFSDLRSLATDYDYNLEDLFYDYLDEYEVEEMLKNEVETWGLARVYYFLWDVNPMACDLYKLNWYWNLEEASYWDLENIIDEIRNRIGEDEEDEEDEETENN